MSTKDEAIAAILTRGMEVATQTGVWLQEQTPDVIQQLLLVKGIESCFLTVVYAIGAGYGIYKIKSECFRELDVDPKALLGTILVSLIAVMSVLATSKASVALKIFLAPKLYLLEYAASLLKGS